MSDDILTLVLLALFVLVMGVVWSSSKGDTHVERIDGPPCYEVIQRSNGWEWNIEEVRPCLD